MLNIDIYRYHPEHDTTPSMQRYELDDSYRNRIAVSHLVAIFLTLKIALHSVKKMLW